MPLKLTILGSGSALPTIKRAVTSQYLNFNERRILIDCGEGTQIQCRKFGVKFQRLQYIFISHMHGDHFLGIFGLLASMNLLGRDHKLTIFAPPELEEIVSHQFNVMKVQMNYEIEFVTLEVKQKELIFEDNIIEVFAFPLKHRIPCYGFLFKEKGRERNMDPAKIAAYGLKIEEIVKIKKGEDLIREELQVPNEELTFPPPKPLKYAYCSDTMYVENLPDWIKDADLLYHEATFTEKQSDRAISTGHSTAKQAATIAKKANVGKLLLGHFSARFKQTDDVLIEAKEVFENTVCVNDGDQFKF